MSAVRSRGAASAAGVVLALAGLAGCGGGDRPAPAAAAVREAPAAVSAVRFVRLQATSEVNGNVWTSVAELELLDAAGAALPRNGWTASADSQETVGEFAPAALAIDGRPDTFWHTQWQGANPAPPHTLTVGLGAGVTLGGFRYLPRQVGENGRIGGWRFFTSTDGSTWTVAAQGVFPNSTQAQTVMLADGANRVPVLAAVADRSDPVGTTVSLSLNASDADGDPLRYTAAGLPPGLSIDAASGRIGGTPSVLGRHEVTVQADDARGGIASRSFAWTVTAASGLPTARHVRLEATAEINGQPWTSVAEFDVLDADGAPVSRAGWVARADSQETAGENAPASRAIDGDPNSFWHTQWQGASPPPPHHLSIDMGTARAVGGFRYLPRQGGLNGRIRDWRFLASSDGSQWTLLGQGRFPTGDAAQTVMIGGAAVPLNRSPSLAAVAAQSAVTGRPFTLALSASDPDGDLLSFAASNLPDGLSIAAASGLVSGTPVSAGTGTATVSVSDGRGGSDARSFGWTVTAPPANRAPTLQTPADRRDTVGTTVALVLSAVDPDGDALAFSASGLPAGLAIDASTGRIGGTPTTAASSRPTVRVSDGRGGESATSFAWDVVAGAAAAGSVRYVRLEALSEVNGNPWSAVAELNLLDEAGATIPRTGWLATADSQEVNGEYAPASAAIDGSPGSFWHTQWQAASPSPPHRLTIDLGSSRTVGGFRYLPRQSGSNGRIAAWRFHTSPDGVAWTQVAQGSFADGDAEQRIAIAGGTTPVAPPPSASRAARIAAYASGPLVAGPAWRAGESVGLDAVRRLDSGHHIVYTAAGTTGGAAPVIGSTAYDGRPIADGSAVAYVTGRTLVATRPGAPVVGSAASPNAAGLIETRFAQGDFRLPRLSAVQGCRSISTGFSFIGHYCFANGPAAGSGNATAIAAGPFGAGMPAAYAYHANSWEEEFVVTGDRFGLVFANSASSIQVEIDGVPVQAAPVRSSGAEGWTATFDYQGVSRRRTVRVVSAAGSVAPTLRGVALTAQGAVEAGTTSNDQLLVLGDSINVSVVPATEAGAQMLSYWLQRHLGFGAVVNMAVGGSGYVSQNPNTYNLPALLANPANRSLLAGYAPNIRHVVVGAGFNDRFRPAAEVQAAALSTWRALRSLLPDAKISITDGWSGSSGPDANALATSAAIAQAFVQWGDPQSRLIRSVGTSAATAYVHGTGHAGLPITSGNSSFYTSTDAVHPSPAGARYLARRLADDIGAAWGGAY